MPGSGSTAQNTRSPVGLIIPSVAQLGSGVHVGVGVIEIGQYLPFTGIAGRQRGCPGGASIQGGRGIQVGVGVGHTRIGSHGALTHTIGL